MKHLKMQFLIAIAAVAAGMSSLQANTVAWYHFNEGESGETASGGQPVVLNAADPTSLSGKPYVATGKATTSATGDNLPAYTNEMPSCVSWYDPVTGARGGDNRSLFLKTNNRKGSYGASTVLIDDDEALHCENITVEMMIKASPDAAAQYASGDWLHALSMVSDVTNNKRAWGIMIRGAGEMFCYFDNYKDSSKSINGYSGNPYFYSTWVTSGIPKITDGKWHHVAMTYDGETARLYVDYTLRGSCAYAGPIAYNDGCNGILSIGPNYANSYGGWDGFIDEVRISDEALPPEKFLQIGGLNNHASDPDTAVYLPFNSLDFSTDNFFGTVGQLIFHNSACSTNASLINLSLSTIAAGVYPRLDTGVSAVVSNELHAGIFAADTIMNEGCWTYTNNPAYPEKARHVKIDDYSKNNGTHLITSGDFTTEFYLKVPTTPTSSSLIVCENSGSKTTGTLYIQTTTSQLQCHLTSQAELEAYDSGAASSADGINLTAPISNVVGGEWHHVALVVSRTNQTVRFYIDRKLIASADNFMLASSVSTYSDSYKPLFIGDGWGGNNTSAMHGLSIDEFRITRRALAPQEFLMAGAALASGAIDPTRAWIGFEGDLSVAPSEGAIPEGSSNATSVTMAYSPVVPGISLVDGNGNVIRETNTSSMRFSGATADTSSQRLFFERNILLERDMKSMTVEFFMKGTRDEAKGWATILRMYGNDNGSDNRPYRRLWSIGYSDAAGHIYVIKDINGGTQTTFYPTNDISSVSGRTNDVTLADGRWHHIAITFAPDGNGKTLCNVYRDYKQIGDCRLGGFEHAFNGEMECGDYGASSMAIGSRYNGYIDEIRISKGVLSVDQMLHVEKRGMIIRIR